MLVVDEIYLQAISVAAVFFGAITYIGNGPNFMVKSISERAGITMPSFFTYIIKYSLHDSRSDLRCNMAFIFLWERMIMNTIENALRKKIERTMLR